ncbi:MAG TPA: MmgE/PrpD family protein [Burkholderiales bacterium]|nr:MmgE/PrpD family protein [Burkholderiales bacterium]
MTGATISPLMRRLAAYIARAAFRPLPAQVTERAKLHLLDTLAAMLSGSRLLPGRRAIAYARAQGGAREACVAGTRLVTSAVNAALANGMLAHADETDDAYYGALVHPGCSVVPAALAMAERHHRGGEALLRAVVLGYDVCARVSAALGVERLRSAGHSTHSIGGTFGSAAAAGALAAVNAEQARWLLSYAAQQASGLSCWARDTEHIEKAFDFGGMPARNGVTAATMVASGFTGVQDVFSGERGFFHAYARFAEPYRLVEGLGRRYDILNTAIKRWEAGYPVQAPLDALAALIAEHGVRDRDVERVRVTIDEQGARTVNRRTMASINLQHLVALMLVDGEITFASAHDEARVSDPRVRRLRARVELVGSRALASASGAQAVVEVATRDGRRLRHHTRAVRGSAANPMSREEVAAKAHELIAPVLGARRAALLIETVWNIERVRDATRLRPLLQA